MKGRANTMSLREYLDKLIKEHKETETVWTEPQFRENMRKDVPSLKKVSEEVWTTAYSYYRQEVEKK